MLLSDFGKVRKPHTDPRKHKFASETICAQCSHLGEALRMWFVFILPDSIWDKGLVLVITIPTAHHGAHIKTLKTVRERLDLHSCSEFFPGLRGSAWAFLRTGFTRPSPWLGTAPCGPRLPSLTGAEHLLLCDGGETRLRNQVNNNSPQLPLSERLTISGKEVNKYMYKVQSRGENFQSTGERFNGGERQSWPWNTWVKGRRENVPPPLRQLRGKSGEQVLRV